MPRPLLFCNIGWMRNYQGQTDDDKIIGGGRYVQIEKRGHEVCNFVVAKDKVLGYVQPVGGRIVIRKLGAAPGAEKIEGIDVVITARRPGGNTVVVGWFKNATVYEEGRPLTHPTTLHQKNGIDSYRYETQAKDVKLLPPEQRTMVVPRGKGGIGQSNVWYAEKASGSWLSQVRTLIERGSPGNLLRGKRPPPDHFKNSQVEEAAMSHVWAHYEKQGYELQDVSKENRGWDLEAISGTLTLRIEVKGLSGASATVELTPNEYKAFSENSYAYRLCIVTNVLSGPSLSICTFNLASSAWALDADDRHDEIKITERVAATIAVT